LCGLLIFLALFCSGVKLPGNTNCVQMFTRQNHWKGLMGGIFASSANLSAVCCFATINVIHHDIGTPVSWSGALTRRCIGLGWIWHDKHVTKRCAGLKGQAVPLPGHGAFMDRIDSGLTGCFPSICLLYVFVDCLHAIVFVFWAQSGIHRSKHDCYVISQTSAKNSQVSFAHHCA